MVEGLVPPVMVGEKEQRPIWSTDDERMHVGEFSAMRHLDRLNLHLVGERATFPGSDRYAGKHALLHHEGPLRRGFDEGQHGRGSIERKPPGVQRLATEQTQPVDVTEVGMGQQHGLQWRVVPDVELFAKRSRGFDEMPLAVLVRDAEAHGMAGVVGLSLIHI